jgi:hypothetical protein
MCIEVMTFGLYIPSKCCCRLVLKLQLNNPVLFQEGLFLPMNDFCKQLDALLSYTHHPWAKRGPREIGLDYLAAISKPNGNSI